MQDNTTDGAGICVHVVSAQMSGIQVGDQVSVTTANISISLHNSQIYAYNATNVTRLGSGNAYAIPATLQQLKEAHYPTSRLHILEDSFQFRLVYLQNLTVIGSYNSPSHSGWIVEDADHVRDTIDFSYSFGLEEGQTIKGLIALNCRTQVGMTSYLRVRSSDDIITHSLFQARRLANTNTPVDFSGTVIAKTTSHLYLQATDAANITTGIALNYWGDYIIGDIVNVRANKVRLNEIGGNVYIAYDDIIDIAVVGHDDAPRVRNMTLEGMKNTHYPATPQRVVNDIYQHTLVKMSNLTVVSRIEGGDFDGDYIIKNASGTRDTLTTRKAFNLKLQQGMQLASVTAVNCRESSNMDITPKPLNLHNLFTTFSNPITISEIQNTSNDGIIADFSNQHLTVTYKDVIDDSSDRLVILYLSNDAHPGEILYAKIYQDNVSTSFFNYVHDDIQVGQMVTSIKGTLNVIGDRWDNPSFQIMPRTQSDIEIATPNNINLSVYPSELNSSLFNATLTQNGGEAITEAAPGQRVYLHLSTTTPDNPSTINYLKASNANYSKLMHHSTLCTNHPELQLTRVNSTCWSFVMPNEDVDMEALFTPTPNYGAICSDVWEAREGARQSLNEPAKLAYLLGRVTCFAGNNYYIEDARNANIGGDLLKSNNAILVAPESNISHSVSIGDLVYVQGYPSGISGESRIILRDARLLNTAGHSDIDNPYVTDLAGLYDDLLVDGRNQYNSRLQDRMVLLSDIQVGSYTGTYSIYDMYEVTQTVNNVTKNAILYATDEIGILEGRTLKAKVLNCTEPTDDEPSLLLRSIDDIPGLNEITFGTNRVEFDEYGQCNGETYVSVPFYIGANVPVSNDPDYSIQIEEQNIDITAQFNYNHTAVLISVSSSYSTNPGIGSVTVTVDGQVSEPLIVVQTPCAPAEFTLSPSYYGV